MVITCPSCSARYRLNPGKIQGRGAKITCPKCAHVFVVFTDDQADEQAASPPQAAPPPVAPPRTPQVAAPPTSPADERAATTTGAFAAVGIDPAALAGGTSSNIRIVAPGSRSTRRTPAGSTLSTPGSALPSAPEVTVHRKEGEPEKAITSAGELDFRSVGIKTWKVKVAIGLIYDFSDIATLKKYLADKKVTPDDLISHNNADWTRIGDIPNLEQHFIDTWRSAKEAVDSGEVELPKPKKKAPESPISQSNVKAVGATGSSTGSYATQGSASRGLTSSSYAAAPRRRPKAEPEPEEKPFPWMVVAAAAVLALAAVWFFWPSDQPSAKGGDPAPVAVENLGEPSDAEREAIKQRIARQLEENRKNLVQEAEPTPEESDAEEARSDRLVAVAPSEQRVAIPPPTPTPTLEPPRPQYQAPPRPVAAQQEGSTGSSTSRSATDPSRMYLEVGRKKLAAGDFGSARSAFQTAISKNDQCGECYRGLADAERGLGNMEAAAAAQKKASSLGGTQSLAQPL